MGIELDTSSIKPDTDISGAELGAQVPDSSRRRFARNAVVGGAVFLSLGNRAAWGADQICMPASVFASFDGVESRFASMPPAGRTEQWYAEHNTINAQTIYDANQVPNNSNYEPVAGPEGQVCVAEKAQTLTTFDGPLSSDKLDRQVKWREK